MSCSSGFAKNKNMKLTAMALFDVFFFFFTSIICLQASSMAEEDVKPLYNYLSRNEMVKVAGYGEEKLSTVMVTGTALCEACLRGEPQLRSWPIPGASVTVNCRTRGKLGERTSSAQVVTDEFGDFVIDLPSRLHSIPDLERTCCLEVLRIPRNSSCRPAHVRKQKTLKLLSADSGTRHYSIGTVNFLHLLSRPLQACNNK
ncbi:hypothetical protein K2173_011058 [Erythroxylum novogranatense]|uniref:Pollen Ole e 1 allergen and extensin family protein n=1 Tax=Erythroxylum novogranatense TaxID=1862640 RepID=A0AAV8T0K9_9ROSI|nr:hypothetical protein K2173_011058 [Erythroxylum novogranatense]